MERAILIPTEFQMRQLRILLRGTLYGPSFARNAFPLSDTSGAHSFVFSMLDCIVALSVFRSVLAILPIVLGSSLLLTTRRLTYLVPVRSLCC